MISCSTISETRKILKDFRSQVRTIGLVPTMGALHHGHLSLINRCISENDVTVVSIFVNPTQFNDKTDYEKYPRDLNSDLLFLEKAACDLIFAPMEQEIYPEEENPVFDFGLLDKHMEGKYRPGHFTGVAQVVSKLFMIIKPDRAYFGEKDFQQLAIIKALTTGMNLPVNIIPCPIVREPDGLAMSSRNLLLTEDQRRSASRISQVLFKARDMAGKMDINELRKFVVDYINSDPNLQTEYFEIVDDTYLQPVQSWADDSVKVACIAVKAGQVRLIDNIKFL